MNSKINGISFLWLKTSIARGHLRVTNGKVYIGNIVAFQQSSIRIGKTTSVIPNSKWDGPVGKITRRKYIQTFLKSKSPRAFSSGHITIIQIEETAFAFEYVLEMVSTSRRISLQPQTG